MNTGSAMGVRQLAVRIYNLIMKENWPECRIETGEKIGDYDIHTEPCNEPSEILKLCSSTENPQNCMQEEIISRISQFKIMTNVWATEEEKQEIKKLFERRNGLKELTKILDSSNEELYEKLISDMSTTQEKYKSWWNRMGEKYKWEGMVDGKWEVNFETNDIYLIIK